MPKSKVTNSAVTPGKSKAPVDLPHWKGWMKSMQSVAPVKNKEGDD